MSRLLANNMAFTTSGWCLSALLHSFWQLVVNNKEQKQKKRNHTQISLSQEITVSASIITVPFQRLSSRNIFS